MYGSHLILTAPLRGKRGGDDLNFPQSKGPDNQERSHSVTPLKAQGMRALHTAGCSDLCTESPSLMWGVGSDLWDLTNWRPYCERSRRVCCSQTPLHGGEGLCSLNIGSTGWHGGVRWCSGWELSEVVLRRSHANGGKAEQKRKTKVKHKTPAWPVSRKKKHEGGKASLPLQTFVAIF